MLIYTSARVLLDIYVPQNSLWVIFVEKCPTKDPEIEQAWMATFTPVGIELCNPRNATRKINLCRSPSKTEMTLFSTQKARRP